MRSLQEVAKEFQEKWQRQINYLLEYAEGHVTQWEADFIDSIAYELSKEKYLTFKQSSVLRKIYDKVQEKVG